jgi:predicted RNase H-like nuclease
VTARVIAVGADGARGGWATAALLADTPDREQATVWETRLALHRDIESLVEWRMSNAPVAPVAIDIPIGLPGTVRPRACDVAARAWLGGRRASSVFAPPARYLLPAAGEYSGIRALVAARRQSDSATKGLSAQAAGIARKVDEVDKWVRAHPASEEWLFECHPELSFDLMRDGRPFEASKHSAPGAVQRLLAVRSHFPDADDQIAASQWDAKTVQLADLLDAYAALFTAVRIASRPDRCEVLGGEERDDEGLLMRIVV